uniref:YARHG domain-containing protein n=1 Tax=Panagrolaimus sp. PS1159 TaxID=55785 RepID=A0AC35GDX7_9BILA
MSNEFLMNFMLKNGFYLSPTEFKSIYKGFRWSDGEFCYNIHTFNHSIIFADKFKAHVLAEKHDKEKSYFKDVYFFGRKTSIEKAKNESK